MEYLFSLFSVVPMAIIDFTIKIQKYLWFENQVLLVYSSVYSLIFFLISIAGGMFFIVMPITVFETPAPKRMNKVLRCTAVSIGLYIIAFISSPLFGLTGVYNDKIIKVTNIFKYNKPLYFKDINEIIINYYETKDSRYGDKIYINSKIYRKGIEHPLKMDIADTKINARYAPPTTSKRNIELLMLIVKYADDNGKDIPVKFKSKKAVAYYLYVLPPDKSEKAYQQLYNRAVLEIP